METLFEYLFVFCSCATLGWCIEFVYRGIRHRKVVNPGFLTGFCLPIYGAGGLVLYFLSGLKLRFMPNEGLRVAAILVLAMIIMTLIELVGGLISLNHYHVRLWDYSGEWMNFKGVICPKFSLFWGIICALYYFFLYKPFYKIASGVILQPLLILAVGFYLGVFAIDMAHSLRLMQRVRAYADQMRTHINLDQLKASAREHFRKEAGRRHAPFNFYRMINRYIYDLHKYRDDMQQKWGEKK